MNIWNELAVFGCMIADNRLQAAWERMVSSRAPEDCKLVQEIAGDNHKHFIYWKLAYRAEELAEIEQSFAREIIRVKK